MRRTTIAVALVLWLSLVSAPEVLAGGGLAGEPTQGKIGAPWVSATIVIDPTFGSPTKGRTSIRLQKGSSVSGAIFIHEEATQPAPVGWVLGCDSVNGAKLGATGYGDWDVNTLTADVRFVKNRLRSWIPDSVLTALFAPLGIQVDPNVQPFPAIASVSAPVCTAADTFPGEDLTQPGNGDGICNPGPNQVEICIGKPKYILSFTATIGFEQ